MITVKVRNPLWNKRHLYAYPIQEFNYHTGELVPNPRWCNEDQFCLTTGNPAFPFRVIDKNDVAGAGKPKKTVSTVKTVSVPGSKPGSSYLVTVNGSNSSCTCVGFGYRGDCKHIRMAEAV
jgi:hypothetical protein